MPEFIPLFGKQLVLYKLFGLLGTIVTLIVGEILGRKYSFSYFKSMVFTVLALEIRSVLLTVTSLIAGGGQVAGYNHVRIVVALPIILLPFTFLFKERFWKVTDFVAPLLALLNGIVCIGCMFPGCCHGYPSSWGLYSNIAGTVCFPLQPIEVACALLSATVLLVMTKYKIQQGRLYAWYLIIFGSTRFLMEFLRDDEKIWLGMSEFSFHALAAFVVGLTCMIVLNILHERSRRINETK